MPFETLHRFADGSPRWMLVRISKMRQSAEAPVRYIAEGFDITGQRRAEERLKLAAGVFRDTQEAILSVDAEGIVIDANTAFFALPGAKADIIGRPVADLRLNGTAPGAFGEAFAQAREHGHWHGQIAQSDPAAEEVAEWSLSVSSVRGADGNILQYVFLLLDISGDDTEQKRKAYYDSLTDMPNRIAFANRLMQALASAKGRQEKVGLVCLEVFDLRPINEACGRVVGDQLLEAVGLRLCALLRRADLSTRLGGTEFALVLNHLEQPAELEAVLNRVQAAFDEPFAIGKHTLRLEVAIGATFYPADDAPANELLTHAELALYEAKRLGGERWELFEPQTGLPRSAQAKAEASLTPLPNGLKKRRRATASA
jgi:diguanylate cyclase (GGDEF)-like protein